MKSVFEASTGIEAHMINNLLHLNDIQSEVFGEHLQGGIGDLQAIGVIRVMVSDDDYEDARKILEAWESKQVTLEQDTQPREKRGSFGSGLLGFFIGVATIFAFLQSSIESNGVDYNGDGRLDETWHYMNNQLSRIEMDQNKDGTVDAIYRYGLNGLLKSSVHDNDFDDRFETECIYEQGNTELCRADLDGDDFYELRESYLYGILAAVSMHNPVSKQLKKKQFFKQSRITYEDVDTDDDGKLDTRYENDEFEQVISTVLL